MNAQTTQEALNLALKDLEAWKAAALAAQYERDALVASIPEIRAEAGRAGFLVAMQNYASDTASVEDEELADHYAESIRRGEL